MTRKVDIFRLRQLRQKLWSDPSSASVEKCRRIDLEIERIKGEIENGAE